jgi:methylthioribulose-1-phosphate dehydratase
VNFARERTALAEVMAFLFSKGWAPGTGGNFSIVVGEGSDRRWVMSPSGIEKGSVAPSDLIVLDRELNVLEGTGKPSAEALLHVYIAESFGARSILHVHSVWNTLLSRRFLKDGHLYLEGYEMLKVVGSIKTHETRIAVPIVPNSQDMPSLVETLKAKLGDEPTVPAFLLAGHGLYTWGDSLAEAKRHVEGFEFLFEVEAREQSWGRHAGG